MKHARLFQANSGISHIQCTYYFFIYLWHKPMQAVASHYNPTPEMRSRVVVRSNCLHRTTTLLLISSMLKLGGNLFQFAPTKAVNSAWGCTGNRYEWTEKSIIRCGMKTNSDSLLAGERCVCSGQRCCYLGKQLQSFAEFYDPTSLMQKQREWNRDGLQWRK